MSKTVLAGTVSAFITIVGIRLPQIPEQLRWPITTCGLVGLAISLSGLAMAHLKEDKRRAEFVPIWARLEGTHDDDFKFAIKVKNLGDCAATGIHVRGFIWEEKLQGDLKLLGDEIAHDVTTKTSIDLCFLAYISMKRALPHFVVVTLAYKPGVKSDAVKQAFYFKFGGAIDGKFDRALIVATTSEKQAIERRFAEELKRAGLKS